MKEKKNNFNVEPRWQSFYTTGRSPYLLNPGNLSKLHRKSQDIEPIWIDGLQFYYKNTNSPNRVVFFNSILSHISPSGCRFGFAICPQNNENNSILKTPLFVCDLNPYTLSSNVSLLYHPIPSIRCKIRAQIKTLSNDSFSENSIVSQPIPKWQLFANKSNASIADSTITCEWYGEACTISLNAYKLKRNSGRSTISYLRSISNSWTLGAETYVEWNENQKYLIQHALAARYSGKRSTIATTLSLSNLAVDMTYFKQINKFFQIGTSLVINNRFERIVGSAFYQWDFYDAIVRGKIDSNGSIGITYDRNIFCYGFGISILVNVKTKNILYGFKFGS